MTRKRKKRKKPITKPQFNPPNIVILGLALIIGFALFSAVDNFFYSDDKVKFEEKIDLATLLTVSKYQNKYGELDIYYQKIITVNNHISVDFFTMRSPILQEGLSRTCDNIIL